MEDEARQNVGKHENEFAEQSGDDNRFGRMVDGPLHDRLHCCVDARRFRIGQ